MPVYNSCIKKHKLHPENFLNDEKERKFESGKLRYVPAPTSVIEVPLIVDFIGKNEKTGHPSQKPEAVFDKLILMANNKNDIVFDPMAGSGTTAVCARKHGIRSIICDKSEDYIQMIEKRTGIKRISIKI